MPGLVMLMAGSLQASAQSESGIQAAFVEGLNATRERSAVMPEISAVRTRLAPAVAAPVGSDGRPMSDLAGVQMRVWMSRGRTDLGVGVGALGYVQPQFDPRADGPNALTAATPTMSLGLRLRVTHESSVYADASRAYGLGNDNVNPYVNAKVGMEWKPARSRFGFDKGALGMQLDSGYNLALKPRRGGLALYLRGQF